MPKWKYRQRGIFKNIPSWDFAGYTVIEARRGWVAVGHSNFACRFFDGLGDIFRFVESHYQRHGSHDDCYAHLRHPTKHTNRSDQ